jgi:cell division septation protein DedD
MAFWNNSADPQNPGAYQDKLDNTQFALGQARRRLLGALILLVLACAFIPWMLDSSPRPWGDDVILRMPKNEQPYQAKPAPKPAATSPLPTSSVPANTQVKP